MKKFLQNTFLVIACIIALTYITGYNYLFKGISKTYFRGETGSTIDDGKLFPANKIVSAKPKLWVKDALYNKNKLPAALAQDLKNTKTASFIVIKNGKLLHEEYWDGYTANTPTNSFSMAKGITVLLLGKAIDDGKIKNEDQLFSDFYPQFANKEYGNKLTLKNLAQMEAGLNWDEDYKNPFKPNARAYYGNNLPEAVLLKDFKETPGTKFEYQSGATQLLGFAVRKAVNMPIASYASAKIWKPLGMKQSADWSTDETKTEKTFCCIHAIPRDFAKIGQMMLNDGKVDSLQLFNKKFLDKMKTSTKNSEGAYGMGIWINDDVKYRHYYFWGLLGQYIIVVPEKQLVIVRTGSFENQPKDAKGRPSQVELIVNQVVENY